MALSLPPFSPYIFGGLLWTGWLSNNLAWNSFISRLYPKIRSNFFFLNKIPLFLSLPSSRTSNPSLCNENIKRLNYLVMFSESVLSLGKATQKFLWSLYYVPISLLLFLQLFWFPFNLCDLQIFSCCFFLLQKIHPSRPLPPTLFSQFSIRRGKSKNFVRLLRFHQPPKSHPAKKLIVL